MDVRVHDEPDAFDAAVRPFYAVDPVRHTLALTVLARNLHDPTTEPVMLTAHRDGELSGTADAVVVTAATRSDALALARFSTDRLVLIVDELP